jgi:hypothetical protein
MRMPWCERNRGIDELSHSLGVELTGSAVAEHGGAEMKAGILITPFVIALCAVVNFAHAGAHATGAAEGAKPIGQYSGFEGNEAMLGKAIVAAILESAENNNVDLGIDISGNEREFGLAASKMIKTLKEDGYVHEMNDALVKMTLEFMQHAKNEGKLPEVAREYAMTQFPMLRRVAKLIEETGDKELALIAITDQTTCFFQLTNEVERAPGMITFRAPYGNVLEQTRRMGMHDLTEQEIHEQWSAQHVVVWSDILGVKIEISDWQDDGMVTLSIPEVAEAMAAN